MSKYLLAVDQGTTGTTALVLSPDGRTLGSETHEFPQHYPEPGWVEHEPEEIWRSVGSAVRGGLNSAGVRGDEIAAVGITNQRETTLAWDNTNGEPLHRALVWQDRRTSALCDDLSRAGHGPEVRRTTGLLLDPYFSGTKMRWLLDNADAVARAKADGRLALGTVDSYLIWKLTADERGMGAHLTDVTNASRTLLMNLKDCAWSGVLCRLFGVPQGCLPRIMPSAAHFGRTRGFDPLPDGTPITGVAGDQHAALFGQGCFATGDLKCTYGTGAFLLLNTGLAPVTSEHGLLTTVAWSLHGTTTYALEGSCFIAGAAVGWLRDALGIIERSSDVEALALQVSSTEGVVFVPAFTGLGAPFWDPDARGQIHGLTRGTTKAHIARATLESIALQVNDLLRSMRQDLGHPIARLRVDGGAAANNLLMQLQADVSNLTIERPPELESTARGAAMLAGIGVGLFESGPAAAQMVKLERVFEPACSDHDRTAKLEGWNRAINLVRTRET